MVAVGYHPRWAWEMRMWKILTRKKSVDIEARQMISLLGAGAFEAAQKEAKLARRKDRARARHMTYVAMRIAELSKEPQDGGPRIVELKAS
jgi:hypothetical protein